MNVKHASACDLVLLPLVLWFAGGLDHLLGQQQLSFSCPAAYGPHRPAQTRKSGVPTERGEGGWSVPGQLG